MHQVHAYAAKEPGGRLTPFEYELGSLGCDDVEIAVEHCGICYTDLMMLDNLAGMTSYPFVPGHEVVGTISQCGDHVAHLSVGDRVGLGWHSGYCQCCDQCSGGRQNLCGQAEATIVGRHGGFADKVRAQAKSVVQLPSGIDARTAGPMFCGGIAVFNPLHQFSIPPTASVGILGIGGLGHLALQFCRAWGCEVTAITSNDSKREEASQFGAHDTIVSSDATAMEQAAGRFDLLMSTLPVNFDASRFLQMLRPGGRLHVLGVVTKPLEIDAISMLFGQREVSSSPVGSPLAIATMLQFAARHSIRPKTEHFPLDQVNEAMGRVQSGEARYRIVLDL